MTVEWTEDEDEQIRTLRAGGMAFYKMAKVMRRNKCDLADRAKEIGAAKLCDSAGWTEEKAAELARMWTGDYTRLELADHFGVSVGSIDNKAADMGLPRGLVSHGKRAGTKCKVCTIIIEGAPPCPWRGCAQYKPPPPSEFKQAIMWRPLQ